MATAQEVLESARTHLNDDASLHWNDQDLMPKLKEAHKELQSKLFRAGVPVIKAVTTVLSVTAGVVDLNGVANYPADIVEPIWLKEREVGQSEKDFVDMDEVNFIPQIQQQMSLMYWCWMGEHILLLGATTNREVKMRYNKTITVPTVLTDTIGFLFGELYMGPRVAALAMISVGNRAAAILLNEEAEGKLETIIGANVKGMQNLPVRRRPYRPRRSWMY